jgi:hypothetical protein
MLGKSAFAAEEGTLLLVASIFRWSVIPEIVVSCATCRITFPVTVFTSAYPLAFPEALAS